MNKEKVMGQLERILQDILVEEDLSIDEETRVEDFEEWDEEETRVLIARISESFQIERFSLTGLGTCGEIAEEIRHRVGAKVETKKPIEQVGEILRTINPRLSSGVDFLAEGLVDSLVVMDIIAHLEDSLGIEIDFDDVTTENFRSVDTIAALVEAKLSGGN